MIGTTEKSGQKGIFGDKFNLEYTAPAIRREQLKSNLRHGSIRTAELRPCRVMAQNSETLNPLVFGWCVRW